MEGKAPSPLQLRRIDPTRNMQRFYTLSIQPTLFGGASLVRDWGRIGSVGRSMIETFDEADAAGLAMWRLEQAKRRKGYRESDADETRRSERRTIPGDDPSR